MTLRARILLTLVPLLVLIAGLGGAGIFLLYWVSGSIDAILRENYESVIAMEGLNEALERIDSSFQFALAGKEEKARTQYQHNWGPYLKNLDIEQHNITLPGEGELVEELTGLTEDYRRKGGDFYERSPGDRARTGDYFGPEGLLEAFKKIKTVSGQILRLNQDNMEQASATAQRTALHSLIGFCAGLAGVVVLAGFFAWHTIHSILQPIRSVTQAAFGISAGNLDQVVPALSDDELGQLARSFNTMAHYLRDYRQSHSARLLRAQRTSQASIDSFPDPVLVVDTQGRVEMANPAAQRVLGVSRAGAEPSTPAPDVVRGPPWQPPESLRAPLGAALQEQRPYLPEGFDRALRLRLDNQDCFFLPRILPIRDPYGNTLGAAVQLQDVTRFRMLDEAKSDLVATVSHELKTPLTSVRLAVHLLLQEAVGPLNSKQIELLVDARDNAERLLARIDSLLNLTMLESGRNLLDIRPEAPASLLQAAADAVRPRALDKGITVTVEAAPDLPPVAADARRLGLALDNLLDNAVTYTERGGRIAVGAEVLDDSVVMSVSDTGQGIPHEYLPHVFDRFFRVPGQSRGGTGLGLAIVREIATAHGGSVSCQSTPGAGSVFRLTLPVWKNDPPLAGRAPATSAVLGEYS
jgi:signal transduction histidine kinase